MAGGGREILGLSANFYIRRVSERLFYGVDRSPRAPKYQNGKSRKSNAAVF